ncbi:MAG: hypothetical protein ACREOI_26440 [bacterium]
MKYAKIAIPFVLFVALGCSNENPVSEPEAKTVSFTGQFFGKNQVGSSVFGLERCSGDLISLNLAGTGQFTQIGVATVELAHCARPEPISSNPLTLEVLYGKIVLVGANGDKIHIAYAGSVVYSGKVVLTGEFYISGGAGRFSGANGNGTFVCEMTGADNEFVSTLKGEISSSRASGI